MNNVLHKRNDWFPKASVEFFLHVARSTNLDVKPIYDEVGIAIPTGHFVPALANLSRFQVATILRKHMMLLTAYVYRQIGYSAPSFDDELVYSCIMAGETLSDVIQRAGKFVQSINGDSGALYIDTNGNKAAFIMDTNLYGDDIHTVTYNMFSLFSYYKLFSWLISESLSPEKITIAHTPHIEKRVIAELVDCPVEFSGKRNAIFFRSELLSRPIVRSSRELGALMEATLFEFMPPPRTTRLSVRLERLLKKLLDDKAQIPGSDQIAAQLGKSGQTLRRHLAQENTSFQHILDKCRIEKATQLLGQTNLTIEEISDVLGFSAPSGFSRAFKHWTGYAPSLYRHRPGHRDTGDEAALPSDPIVPPRRRKDVA